MHVVLIRGIRQSRSGAGIRGSTLSFIHDSGRQRGRLVFLSPVPFASRKRILQSGNKY